MDPMMIVLLVVMGLGVFFMISRSSKSRKKDMEMQEKIVVGTRVMTGSGIRGEIVEINKAENSVILKTGTEESPCLMEFDRRAIAYLMSDVLKTLPNAQGAAGGATGAFAVEDTSEQVAISDGEKKTITDGDEVLEQVEEPKGF